MPISRRMYPFLFTMLGIVILKICLVLWGGTQFDFQRSPHENILSIWNRWDSNAYQTIATSGYKAPLAAPDYRAFLSHFPPLFPLAIAAVIALIPIPPYIAALGLSWLFGLLTSCFLYGLVWLEWRDQRRAVLAVAFLNVYPTAYFLITPYTESLFILCGVLTFIGLRHLPKRCYVGGISAGLAILTRLLGIALLPAIAWEVGKKIKNKTLHHHDVWLLIVPVIAIAIYLGINQYYYGQPLFFLQEYNQNIYSNKQTSWPFKETIQIVEVLWHQVRTSTVSRDYMMIQGWNAIFTILATGITLWSAFTKRVPVSYWLYSLTYILLFASFQWGISNARYTLAVFPMFIALGSIKNKAVLGILLLASTVCLFYFTGLFARGGWAF